MCKKELFLTVTCTHYPENHLKGVENLRVFCTHIVVHFFFIFHKMCRKVFFKTDVSSQLYLQGEINEVILMGGGTRIPKIQEILQKTIGR